MMKNNSLRNIFFIALLMFPACIKKTQEKKYTGVQFTPRVCLEKLQQKTEHHLMVFIHGTILPISSLSCCKYQPNGPAGLSTIGKESSLLAQIVADYFTNLYQDRYPTIQLSCYTFGWSGKLNQKKRLQAAHDLYRQLVSETKKCNFKKITLFGHSHGGNVVLNLARAEDTYHQNLVIDKAILLGTPIQSETQALLESQLFSSVYNCYSHGDKIQKIDFVSTQDDYSRRRFPSTPAKLTQIELQLGTIKPGHGELWLQWGKRNSFYRKTISIFPLPAFVFLPEIIAQLESFCPGRRDVMVNIDQKNSNYTIALYDNASRVKKISDLTISKELFTPYIKTILQNEHADKKYVG